VVNFCGRSSGIYMVQVEDDWDAIKITVPSGDWPRLIIFSGYIVVWHLTANVLL